MTQLSLLDRPKLSPQCQQILRVLTEHGSTTKREAMLLSPPCFNLPGRIYDLRNSGHTIESREEPHEGGTHTRYVLVK